MSRMRAFIACVFFVGVLLCSAAQEVCAASDIVVTASFEKREAFVGEEVPLTITISGEFGNVPRPRLPQFEGFSWYYMQQASRVKYSADKKGYYKVLEFIFMFIPQEAGTFTVGPFDVPVERSIFKVPAIEMTVQGGSAVQPPQSQSASSALLGVSAPQSPQMSPLSAQAQSTSQMSPVPASTQSSGQNSQFHSSMMPSKHLRGADSNLFLKAWSDKREVFPGEQVNVTYSLFTRLDTRYEGFRDEPVTKGFWVEDLTDPNKVDQENVTFNGKRYLRADIRKLALFATTPGEYVIEPGVVTCSVARIEQQPQSDYFGSFFQDQFFGTSMIQKREQRELGAEAFSVTVKTFPEKNRPEKFKSMVGAYVLSATIDKDTVQTNEPITVEVTVQGKGNIGTIERPYIDVGRGLRVVEGQSQTHTVSSISVVGWKKYSYMVIPDSPGSYTIGPFYSVFFNPDTEKYVTAESEAFQVSVTKGTDPAPDITSYRSTPISDALKKDVSRVDRAIHYITEHEDSRAYRAMIEDGNHLLSWVIVLLSVGIVLAYFVRREQFRLAGNVALRRYRRALRTFQHAIGKVNKKASSRKVDVLVQCFSEAARVLMTYFADKCNLPQNASTYDQLEEALLTSGIDQAFRDEIQSFFTDCDFARFAPSEVSKEKTRLCVARCKSIVERFERHCAERRKVKL